MIPLAQNPKEWMKSLPSTILEKPLTSLVYPATHDSGSYKLNLCHPISTPEASYLKYTPGLVVFPPAVYFVESWTFTQNYSLYDQLNKGIRCLDLRIAYDKKDFWLVHMFTLISFSSVIKQLNTFIDENPSEIVLLRIKPGWEQHNTMNGQEHYLSDRLKIAFGDKLIHQASAIPTLKECLDANQQVIVFYEGSVMGTVMWNMNAYINTYWANTDSLEILTSNITQFVNNQTVRPNDVLQEVSFVLTPQADDIKTSLIRMLTFRKRDSLKKYAEEVRPLINEMLMNPNIRNFGIVSMDYPTDEIISTIINLNF